MLFLLLLYINLRKVDVLTKYLLGNLEFLYISNVFCTRKHNKT